jgi:putative transposase
VIDTCLAELASIVGVKAACQALGRPRSRHYRQQSRKPPLHGPRREPAGGSQPRALSAVERQTVLDVLHSPRFVDSAPGEVYATLLDEGTYLCSEASMYRLLRSRGEVRERRRQAIHPARTKPELVATAPNQVWSWDITKLAGPVKWSYFHLYTIIDIYSRYIVGWMIAPRESAALAEHFLAETITRHGIDRDQLTIHSDNGSSMASRPVAFLLADLGVTKSHSRPHCSNDNPYSESAFKTLKYRPDFPARFTSLEHARAHGREFFTWYNVEHRHCGIGMLTPADVHDGRVGEVLTRRRFTLAAAHADHPERFARPPQPPAPPSTAYINRPSMDSTNQPTA